MCDQPDRRQAKEVVQEVQVQEERREAVLVRTHQDPAMVNPLEALGFLVQWSTCRRSLGCDTLSETRRSDA